MTTDLTDDFELGEEEFEWDVFVPDPDDAAVAAEAAALEDEADLDLDDSDFDWEAALRDDAEDGEGAARAGAAYDRIVDTVRRSVEEPTAETKAAATTAQAVASAPTTTEQAAVSADDVDEMGASFLAHDSVIEADTHTEHESDVLDLAVVSPMEPEADSSWRAEPERQQPAPMFFTEAEAEPDPVIAFEPEPDIASEMEPASLVTTEPDREPEPVWDAMAWEPDPVEVFEPEPDLEPQPDAAHAEARIAEMAATVAAVAAVDAEPTMSPALEASVAVEEDAAPGTADESVSKKRPRAKKAREKKPRSRVFTATVVLACLVLAVVAAAAVVHSLHHSTTPTPSHTAASVPPSPDTGRIQSATDAVDSATTSAVVGISSLPSFPTPTNVERVINPYVSSLQLYENVLSGSDIPAADRSEAAGAEAQVHRDLTFLETIETLPSVQLGAFLQQFDSDATQLQTTLTALEQNLKTAAS